MSEKPSAEYWEARCNEWMGECDRIRQQRDEARAEAKENKRAFDEISKQLGILMTIRDRQYAEAEARGFERGVQDAADEAERGGNSVEIRDAILALLEKP
jgi:hypothetical protein